METENGACDELPDGPQHEPDSAQEGKTSPDEPAEASDAEQGAPPPLSEGETNTSIVTLPAENPSDERVDASDATEAVPTPLDDEQETPEAEQETAALSAKQEDALAGSIPTRQRSKYTRWVQALAVVLLICVIAGVVFAVRQSTSSHSQVTLGTPTPMPPLNVTKWCTVNSAPVDARAGQVYLKKIVAISANDAWILGSMDKGNSAAVYTGQSSPLLEHWNGKAWSVVPTADTSALLKQLQGNIQQIPDSTAKGPVSDKVALNDIAVLSDNNIWAVGQISVSQTAQTTRSIPGFPGPGTMLQTAGQPLIEHWDGHIWQIVASPVGATMSGSLASNNRLMSISAIATNDIWAMGMQADKSTQPLPGNSGVSFALLAGGDIPLVEHWDGTSWTEQQLPASLQQKGLMFSNIQALSANDVWSFDQAMTFKMVGPINIFNITPVPYNPSGIPSSGTIIVSKGFDQVESSSHILHWNGQSWNEMQLPDDLSKSTSVRGVVFLSDTNIWAFGDELIDAQGTPTTGATVISQWVQAGATPVPESYNTTSVIYHWDGSAWSKVANAPGVDAKSSLESMSVIAPDNLWLLGHTSKNQPLLEHWNGKAWSLATTTSPVYGSATQVTVAGQRAWALIDQYSTPNAQNAQPFTAPDTLGAVLETNC